MAFSSVSRFCAAGKSKIHPHFANFPGHFANLVSDFSDICNQRVVPPIISAKICCHMRRICGPLYICAAALFIFLTAAAGAGIISSDFLSFSLLNGWLANLAGSGRTAAIAIAVGHHVSDPRPLGFVLTDQLHAQDQADHIFVDGINHFLKHLESLELIGYQRIVLSIGS